MKRKPLILVAFLLVLYIGPMILAPSFISPSRQNEPNMVKDFASSTEYTTSNQSITSFAETLPDDVLFYPDGGSETTTSLASAGSAYGPTGTYVDTQIKDLTYYRSYDGSSPYIAWMYLNFTFTESLEKIELSFYGRGVGDGVTTNIFAVYNGTSFVDLDDLYIHNTVNAWTNITITDSDYWLTGNKVMFYSEVTATATTYSYIYCDYMEVVLYIPSMSDSSFHFVETFTVIDDWETPSSGTTGATITSDGDVATITENGPISLGVAYTSFDSTDYFEYYYEFRIDSMTATTTYFCFWDSVILLDYNILKTFTSSGTYKGIISNIDANITQKIGFIIDSNNDNIMVDYLRIFRANESGWSFDGSTTEGVEIVGDGIISTDGSALSIIRGTGASAVWIYVDNTTTRAKYDSDYYPFFVIQFSDACIGNMTKIYVNDGTSSFLVLDDTIISMNTYRFNIRALTANDIQRFLIYPQTAGGRVEVDYMKVYSIANFSYTGSSVTVDDYLYVESNILYSNVDSGNIVLDHDPALSFETERSLWTMSTSSGTPQIDFYIEAAWVGYTSDTSGSFPSGTLTDLRLNFTDNANIEAITFFSPIPQWNLISTAILYFSVPFDMWGYNTGLIILGLVMIPVSTIYLAYGIKHDRSSDRLFYGLIIFMVGCGLFIGGILP